MKYHASITAMLVGALMGCTTVTTGSELEGSRIYSPPEESGLIGVRPYPNPDDVCQLIGENDVTNPYLDDSATLIGCPHHENGAIQDRIGQGANKIGRVGLWVLMSVPGR